MSTKDASREELLNWMNSNLFSIDDALVHIEWIIDSVKIDNQLDSNLFMARAAIIKRHLLEYHKKQKEEYMQMKFGNPIAKHAPAKIYLLKNK